MSNFTRLKLWVAGKGLKGPKLVKYPVGTTRVARVYPPFWPSDFIYRPTNVSSSLNRKY